MQGTAVIHPNAELCDGQTSVYDLARQSFGGTIRLVEHFRCVTEIIQFSNQLSYEGDIKPLRDASRVQLKPHTLTYRVSGSARDGKVNRQEAEVITSLIAAALEQPEYQMNEFKERTGESGCDAWTLARIAGHASITISARYVHPSEDAVLDAMSRLGGHRIGHSSNEPARLPLQKM